MLANTRKQAGIIFDEAKAMVKESPKLREQFRPTRNAIYFDKTISKIKPRGSDSENLDGLNTHLGIFDEIHEFKDYKLINVIKKSRGSRQIQRGFSSQLFYKHRNFISKLQHLL